MSVTTEVTIWQLQSKLSAYKKNWKCIVSTPVYLKAGPSLNFNEQNASHQFYSRNIEEIVAKMHKSQILGKLQEQHDIKKTKTPKQNNLTALKCNNNK